MNVHVVPGSALEGARRLLAGLDAEVVAAEPEGRRASDAALAYASDGEPVLLVPPGAHPRGPAGTVLVPHEGSAGVASGLDVAARLAVAAGGRVVVLHVPGGPRLGPGALAAPRMADHAYHDWTEWRREFARRFLAALPAEWTLSVELGPPAGAVLRVARNLPADLIVAAWKGDAGRGRARTLNAVLAGSPCPILLIREIGGALHAGETPTGHPPQ